MPTWPPSPTSTSAARRASSSARAAAAATAFSDPLEAIHAESVDAVIVATPDEFHTPLTMECLRAGKPVLCEKPLAPTSKEATQVLDLEAELADSGSTVRASLGFMRRFDPGCLQLKERLTSGRLGPR